MDNAPSNANPIAAPKAWISSMLSEFKLASSTRPVTWSNALSQGNERSSVVTGCGSSASAAASDRRIRAPLGPVADTTASCAYQVGRTQTCVDRV